MPLSVSHLAYRRVFFPLNIQHCYDLQGRLVYRGYEGAKVRGYENSLVEGKEGNLAPSHPRTPAPSMKKGIYIVGNKKLVLSR